MIHIEPVDYTATTRDVTFDVSTTRRSVLISVVDDNIQESLEQFFVRLSQSNTGTDVDVELNPAQATIDIVDNDGKFYIL